MRSFVFDLPTLSMMVTAIAFIYSLGLYLFGKTQKKYRGFNWISLALFLIMIGMLFLGARDHWPDVLSVIGSNSLFIIGTLFYYEGFRRVCNNLRGFDPIGVIVSAFGLLGVLFFYFVVPSVNGRIVMFSVSHAWMEALGVILLLKNVDKEMFLPRFMTAISVAVDAAYHIFRMIWSIFKEPMNDLLTAGNVQAIAVIATMFFITGTTFGLVWIVNRGLDLDLMQMAMQDPLTGLLNRRGVERIMSVEIAKFSRHEPDMVVMLLDLDHFKLVNDDHGHSVGDEVLTEFAVEVQRFLRNYDVFGRIGGEEFVIFLPMTTIEDASKVAERIRAHVEEHVFCVGKTDVKITVSIGASCFIPENATLDTVIPFADEALYISKQNGRNKVTCFGEGFYN
jgi:diguanylate cyclase (GGDEF)-like protein